jgi:hypothetical protein
VGSENDESDPSRAASHGRPEIGADTDRNAEIGEWPRFGRLPSFKWDLKAALRPILVFIDVVNFSFRFKL